MITHVQNVIVSSVLLSNSANKGQTESNAAYFLLHTIHKLDKRISQNCTIRGYLLRDHTDTNLMVGNQTAVWVHQY